MCVVLGCYQERAEISGIRQDQERTMGPLAGYPRARVINKFCAEFCIGSHVKRSSVHSWEEAMADFLENLDVDGESHSYHVLGLKEGASESEVHALYCSSKPLIMSTHEGYTCTGQGCT